ncbi:MAG: integrase core domain-containing protein [Bdellovibrionales bacterium]
MPWKEVNRMDQKLEFVSLALAEDLSMKELCAEFGISRKTGYKWLNRFYELGEPGLVDLKPIPKSSSSWCREDFSEIIESTRARFPRWGAPKIYAYLKRENIDCPSPATIGRILKCKKLTRPKAPHVFTKSQKRLTNSSNCNQVWSADFKGQFKSNCGTYNYPLTVADHYSRYIIGIENLKSTSLRGTKIAFTRIFKEHGLPEIIRTDNGVPFTGAYGPSILSIWWLELGITPELTEKGKPQQNGRHERMHRALKEEAIDVKKFNFNQQSKEFSSYIKVYNGERPHQGIENQTPSDIYVPSKREYPDKILAYDYPKYAEVRKTSRDGRLQFRGQRYFFSSALGRKEVGIIPIGADIWEINFRGHNMGTINTFYKTFRGKYLF